MPIGKKTSLRDKSKRSTASKIQAFKQEARPAENHHENPLLKLSKTSKKDKMQAKSANFTERLMNKVTFNTSGGISKSSARRRKRKEKEQLKPNMNELLSSLGDIESKTTNIIASDKTYIKPESSNKPNANNRKGHEKIVKDEGKNFAQVLANPHFKTDPFSALKARIQQNMS